MLRDLAAAAGMSAAKAHRYLVSFQRMGLVIQDPVSTRYDLGPAALRLGLASLSRMDAVKLARERMAELLTQTGHVLAIAVWGNQGPTMVHWVEAVQTVPVTLRLGDVMPLLTSATGRCFAAFMGSEGRDAQRIGPMIKDELARLKKLPSRRPATVRRPTDTWPKWQAVLDETRQHGQARVVHSLLPGVAGFCAPVFDAQGRLAMGMVVLGSVATLDTRWDSRPGARAAEVRATAQRRPRPQRVTLADPHRMTPPFHADLRSAPAKPVLAGLTALVLAGHWFALGGQLPLLVGQWFKHAVIRPWTPLPEPLATIRPQRRQHPRPARTRCSARPVATSTVRWIAPARHRRHPLPPPPKPKQVVERPHHRRPSHPTPDPSADRSAADAPLLEPLSVDADDWKHGAHESTSPRASTGPAARASSDAGAGASASRRASTAAAHRSTGAPLSPPAAAAAPGPAAAQRPIALRRGRPGQRLQLQRRWPAGLVPRRLHLRSPPGSERLPAGQHCADQHRACERHRPGARPVQRPAAAARKRPPSSTARPGVIRYSSNATRSTHCRQGPGPGLDQPAARGACSTPTPSMRRADPEPAGHRDARSTETWRFDIGPGSNPGSARRPLAHPGAHAPAPQGQGDKTVQIWLAPTLENLPVRIRISESNGDFIDQLLEEMPTTLPQATPAS